MLIRADEAAYMSDNVLIAIIGGSGTLLVALASLLVVYRGFNSIERRLEVIEGDIKQFFRAAY